MLEELILFTLATLAGLGCFAVIAWTVLSPETLDVDKIFAVIACLVVALVFFSTSGWMLFHTRLRELWRPPPQAAAPQPEKTSAKKTEQVPQEAGKTS